MAKDFDDSLSALSSGMAHKASTSLPLKITSLLNEMPATFPTPKAAARWMSRRGLTKAESQHLGIVAFLNDPQHGQSIRRESIEAHVQRMIEGSYPENIRPSEEGRSLAGKPAKTIKVDIFGSDKETYEEIVTTLPVKDVGHWPGWFMRQMAIHAVAGEGAPGQIENSLVRAPVERAMYDALHAAKSHPMVIDRDGLIQDSQLGYVGSSVGDALRNAVEHHLDRNLPAALDMDAPRFTVGMDTRRQQIDVPFHILGGETGDGTGTDHNRPFHMRSVRSDSETFLLEVQSDHFQRGKGSDEKKRVTMLRDSLVASGALAGAELTTEADAMSLQVIEPQFGRINALGEEQKAIIFEALNDTGLIVVGRDEEARRSLAKAFERAQIDDPEHYYRMGPSIEIPARFGISATGTFERPGAHQDFDIANTEEVYDLSGTEASFYDTAGDGDQRAGLMASALLGPVDRDNAERNYSVAKFLEREGLAELVRSDHEAARLRWPQAALKTALRDAVMRGHETMFIPRGNAVETIQGNSNAQPFYDTVLPNYLKDVLRHAENPIEQTDIPSASGERIPVWAINLQAPGVAESVRGATLYQDEGAPGTISWGLAAGSGAVVREFSQRDGTSLTDLFYGSPELQDQSDSVADEAYGYLARALDQHPASAPLSTEYLLDSLHDVSDDSVAASLAIAAGEHISKRTPELEPTDKVKLRSHPQMTVLDSDKPMASQVSDKVFSDLARMIESRSLLDQAPTTGGVNGVRPLTAVSAAEFYRRLAMAHGSQKEASMRLFQAGVSGMIENDQIVVGWGVDAQQILSLREDLTGGMPRGTIDLNYNQGMSLITLGQGADASTFLHESAHHYLESLRNITKQAVAPLGAHRDLNTITNWMGLEHHSQIDRHHHEQFAQAYEKYLMLRGDFTSAFAESIDASADMEDVFKRFTGFMKEVYASAHELNVELSTEVVDLFERMSMLDAQTQSPSAVAAVEQDMIEQLQAAGRGDTAPFEAKLYANMMASLAAAAGESITYVHEQYAVTVRSGDPAAIEQMSELSDDQRSKLMTELYGPPPSDRLHQIGGQAARTFPKDSLALADKLDASGASDHHIFNLTGLFKGDDDKWRFNVGGPSSIDDESLERLRDGESVLLESVLDNPRLYEAYPNVGSCMVVPVEGLDGASVYAPWGSKGGMTEIRVGTPSLEDPVSLKADLAHETQHLIQMEEGFDQGYNVAIAIDDINFVLEAAHYRAMIEDGVHPYKAQSQMSHLTCRPIMEEDIEAWERIPEKTIQTVFSFHPDADSFPPGSWPKDYQQHDDNVSAWAAELYRNWAGELEAQVAASIATTPLEQQTNQWQHTSIRQPIGDSASLANGALSIRAAYQPSSADEVFNQEVVTRYLEEWGMSSHHNPESAARSVVAGKKALREEQPELFPADPKAERIKAALGSESIGLIAPLPDQPFELANFTTSMKRVLEESPDLAVEVARLTMGAHPRDEAEIALMASFLMESRLSESDVDRDDFREFIDSEGPKARAARQCTRLANQHRSQYGLPNVTESDLANGQAGSSLNGLELRKVSAAEGSGLHCLISMDASDPDQWRVTKFDERGPIGHTSHRSAFEALGSAVASKFEVHAPGSIDRLCQKWISSTEEASEKPTSVRLNPTMA